SRPALAIRISVISIALSRRKPCHVFAVRGGCSHDKDPHRFSPCCLLGTACGGDRGDALSGGASHGRLRRIELLRRLPMRQLFGLLLACTLAAGSSVGRTHHSTASSANCADYSGTSW